jgi:hypothetical protein
MQCENAVEPRPLLDRILSGEEQALSFNKAAKLPELQRDNRAPALGQLYRYARRGVRGVVLEASLIGGSLVTTREAVGRFLQKLNDPDARTTATVGDTPRRQGAAAKRAHDAAMRELTRAGLAG